MNEELVTDIVRIARDSSSMPLIPIKYPGQSFDPPNGGKYIEIVHVSTNVNNQIWGNELKTVVGTIRLLLHWPQDKQGSIPPKMFLKEFEDYFVKNSIFRNDTDEIKITDNPENGGIFPAGHDTFYMLSIPYHQTVKRN